MSAPTRAAEIAFSIAAMATVSMALKCGCSFPPATPIRAAEAVHPGTTVTCPRHGRQIVTRTTLRLAETAGGAR